MPRHAAGLPAADIPHRPDALSLARFSASLTGLWPQFAGDDSLLLGIAVSGGPDSMALLMLASAAFPGRIRAATVDHRLRAESGDEARFVSRHCAKTGVPHAILGVDVAPGNVQSQARTARYRALGEWMRGLNISHMATAHHADDQAETLLLRMNRASGVAGLAGVRAVGPVPGSDSPASGVADGGQAGGGLTVLRPLLDWRRADLARIVADAGVDTVDDPGNRDERFDRARMRATLRDADWIDVSAVAASAMHIADGDAALEWATDREWRDQVVQDGSTVVYRPVAPRAIALRIIARIAVLLDGRAPRGSAAARAYDALVAGRAVTIGNVLARPLGPARPSGDVWRFGPAPPRGRKQH